MKKERLLELAGVPLTEAKVHRSLKRHNATIPPQVKKMSRDQLVKHIHNIVGEADFSSEQLIVAALQYMDDNQVRQYVADLFNDWEDDG